MPRPQIQSLEPRLLFSTFTVDPNVSLGEFPGGNLHTAITGIGSSGNSVVVYNTGTTVSGKVLDPSANILSESVIATLPSNNFGQITAKTTPQGNAVVAYNVFTSANLNDVFVLELDTSGRVLIAPKLVTPTSTGDQKNAALAIATSGDVCVSYLDNTTPGSGDNRVESIVLDSSLNSVAPPVQLSLPNTDSGTAQILGTPANFFDSSTGNFINSWVNSTYTTGFARVLGQNIFGASVSQSNAIVTAQTTLVTGNTTDGFSEQYYTDGPSFLFATQRFTGTSFNGSTIFNQAISHTLVPIGSPNTIFSTSGPQQNYIGSVFPFVTNQDGFDSGKTALAIDDGTLNASNFAFTGQNARILVLSSVDGGATFNVETDNTFPEPPGLTDPFLFISPAAAGNVFPGAFVATNPGPGGTTDLFATPVDFTPSAIVPDATPAISVSDGVESSDKSSITFTLTLSQETRHDVTVVVKTRDGSATSNPFYKSISDTFTMTAGKKSIPITVTESAAGFDARDFFLDLSAPTGATLGDASGEGIISAAVQTSTPTTGTFTAKKGLIATDAFGTLIKFTIVGEGEGKVTATPGGGARLDLKKTNKKTRIIGTASPAGKTIGTGRFILTEIVATTPFDSLIAGTIDIARNVTLAGASAVTLGSIRDNHQISLGQVNQAVIKFDHIAGAKLTAAGSIKSLSFTDWLGGSITATSIGTLSSTGALNADISATSLTTLAVGGALGGTSNSDVRTLRAKTSIGTISAAAVAHQNIYAGVRPAISALPTSRSAFVSAKSSINSLIIKGASPVFSDSIIAAPVIGTLQIIGLVPANSTPFGVATERITTYRRDAISMKNIFSKKPLDSAGQYSANVL